MCTIKRGINLTIAVAILLLVSSTAAFVSCRVGLFIPIQQNRFETTDSVLSNCGHSAQQRNIVLTAAASSSDAEMKDEINKMRVKEIRDELESYGINTKSFLEKSELIEALITARKEGKTPINDVKTSSSSSTTDTNTYTNDDSSRSANRKERIQEEMENCKSMKVSDLKKELESYGISTKSYLEKSEFVRAVAEARVDGIKKSSSGGPSGAGQQTEEQRDPSFRDVTVSKLSGDSKMGLGGTVIDVKAR